MQIPIVSLVLASLLLAVGGCLPRKAVHIGGVAIATDAKFNVASFPAEGKCMSKIGEIEYTLIELPPMQNGDNLESRLQFGFWMYVSTSIDAGSVIEEISKSLAAELFARDGVSNFSLTTTILDSNDEKLILTREFYR